MINCDIKSRDKNALIVKCVARILDEISAISKNKNDIVDAVPGIKFAVREFCESLTFDAGDHNIIDSSVGVIIDKWVSQNNS